MTNRRIMIVEPKKKSKNQFNFSEAGQLKITDQKTNESLKESLD